MAGSAWPAPRSIGAALGITLGVALALAVFFGAFPSGSLWTPFEPGDCAEYCEASTRCGGFESRGSIQQPLNSWSSLAFVFVGVLALARPLHAGRVLFFVSCTVLGIGSFLFHASVTREMQWLDMVGTYSALVAVAATGWQRTAQLSWAWLLPAAVLADGLIALFKWRMDAYVVMPALMLVIAVPAGLGVRRGKQSAANALLPLGLFLLAFAFRQADVERLLCWPGSGVFQGHALWHVLTAASLWTMFGFFQASGRPARLGNA